MSRKVAQTGPKRETWWQRQGMAVLALVCAAATAVGTLWLASKDTEVNVILPASEVGPPATNTGCWDDSEAGSSGWGPERPMFTGNHAPNYPALNSTADNPNIGDERNYVAIRPAETAEAVGWQDSIEAQPGEEYLVRVYVNNAAVAEDLVATRTRLSVTIPTCAGRAVALYGFLTSTSTFPSRIWDGVHLTARQDFKVSYVPDSAVIYNNEHGDGHPLRGATGLLRPEGELLGYSAMDGEIPPSYQHAGYVTFRVRTDFQTP